MFPQTTEQHWRPSLFDCERVAPRLHLRAGLQHFSSLRQAQPTSLLRALTLSKAQAAGPRSRCDGEGPSRLAQVPLPFRTDTLAGLPSPIAL